MPESGEALLRRLARAFRRRRDDRPARVILIDETGHRMEFIHDADDPIFWNRLGEDGAAGFRHLQNVVDTFIESRGPRA